MVNPSLEVVLTLIAVFGGVAKHLSESAREKKPIRPGQLLIRVIVAAFCGWIFAHSAMLMTSEINFIAVCAGVGGYMGTDSIDMVIQYVKSRFTKPPSTAV